MRHGVDGPLGDICFGISTREQKIKEPLEQALWCLQQPGVPALMDVYPVFSCSKQRRDPFCPKSIFRICINKFST